MPKNDLTADDSPLNADEPVPQEQEPRPLSRWAWIVGIAGVVAYPLSIGPVYWLDNRKVIPASLEPALELFFTPLGWLYNSSPQVNHLMNAYFLWWD